METIINNNNNPDLKAVDVKEEPIILSGLHWVKSNSSYCRLPENRLSECNNFVVEAAPSTAGVNICFKTNSKIVGLEVLYGDDPDYSHIPRSGTSGFDFYLGSGKEKKFAFVFYPEAKQNNYSNKYDFGNNEMKELTIYFPLYRSVKDVKILIEIEAEIYSPTEFSIEKSIAFYGSSITQGACASRPGNCYTNILSRWLNANSINLGFSSGALAEPFMAEMISEIDMSVFVMDYDYNAQTIQYLDDTHEKFYKLVRARHSKVPIIFITRPNYHVDPIQSKIRQEVIYRTFQNALQRNENVYFVDGSMLFGNSEQESCTVDGCHPNDLGFMRMAEYIYPTLKTALLNEGYLT